MPQDHNGNAVVKKELGRRVGMWRSLLAAGGPKEVPPTLLRNLGIYGGGQGIWVNKHQTGSLTDQGMGVTVGLLHTGVTYADDLSGDGVLYHYPATNRPPGRDLAEIDATKSAGALGLPIFVITHSDSSVGKRDVHLGWVEDWDDSLGIFLVIFGDEGQSRQHLTELEEPFELIEKRETIKKQVRARPGQKQFSFYVFQRYGHKCAVCSLSIPEVLDAAHLVPERHEGSYDPRNGLVLCAVHHRAFDAGLFAIDPDSLEICFKESGPEAEALRIDYETLEHLPQTPHEDALRWRWNNW